MKQLLLIAGLGLVLISACRSASPIQALPVSAVQPACLEPSSLSQIMVSIIARMASDSMEAYVEFRQQVHVPGVSWDEVVLVTDHAICRAAAAAFSRHLSTGRDTPRRFDRVYVVQVKNSYLVFTPDARMGEWQTTLVFTKDFSVLSTIGL